MSVLVIVSVAVIEPVMVAALGNGNVIVPVIDIVDDRGSMADRVHG